MSTIASIKERRTDLLDRIAETPAMAAKLRRVEAGEAETFEHVNEAAQPFVCALLSRIPRKRIWVVASNIRAQETLHNELLNWHSEALFFPETEVAPVEGAVADPESTAERLGILQQLVTGKGRRIVVITRNSLDDPVPSAAKLKKNELRLTRGSKLDRDKLIAQLDAAGYEHVGQVALRGQYAVRGGILDVFSFHHSLPVRIELFDDDIESLRHFDLDAQTSVQHLDVCTLMLEDVAGEAGQAGGTCPLSEYIGRDDLVIDVAPEPDSSTTARNHVRLIEHAESASGEEDFSTAFHDHGLGEFEAGDFVVDELKRERFFHQLRDWRVDGWCIQIFCNNEGEVERLTELIPDVELDAIEFIIGSLAHGFTFPAGKVAVLSDAELFGRYRHTRARRIALRRARDIVNRSQIDFSELNEGDLVVHLEHGIGRYEGLRKIPKEGAEEEVLVLEFANDSRLYVPLEQSYLVSRYVGIGKKNPPLSSLGDAKWAKAKKSAEKAVYDYAAKLLQVHAERETARGYAFPPDNKWQREFEASFLFKETPDQVAAIAASKTDMESERPMDRLICGDVGFGKTEVAIRAAFKAASSGKQVAMLAPTTVLAEQHYRNFRERMSDYPIAVEMLSRFRTAAEQRKTLEGLKNGSVDIVIGTHRLISKDIQFKDLGLVVIDEEQRFGVLHKERFKEMFRLVDMLTLSATPIPRTLYLSLMGAKDMSTLETPPLNRIPVETLICPYDERIIRDAIQRELQRQGQVYFLHNRVNDIERVRDRIQALAPKARIVIGHGQMDEHELEEVMKKFIDGEADVLVSTTIIESGIDIPNANTIIIDRADRFGLADLYQLRGRVGRAQTKAYAYLMLPREMMTMGEARKRINAIKQYSSLGAGFKIAMRDLEIRGAGNILGTQQSGHIINIGFDLYCSLLKQAVAQHKGEKVRPRLEVAMRLDFAASSEADFLQSPEDHAPAFLPISYIAESQPRIQAYRRLNEITTQEQLDALRKTWRDRFGKPPQAVENLLLMAEIKLAAAGRKMTALEVKDKKVMLTRAGDFILIAGKFPRLANADPNERLQELLKLIRSF
ncbi:transcription-repair coupling factor [Verrucomicrobiota bacterium sgz303538]